MIIDNSHRGWIIATGFLFVAATIVYWLYASSAPQGPTGGSTVGVVFGLASGGLMVFAALLSVRKRFPRRPWGRVQTWLRAHIWLGLLSVPLSLYHAGFHWGGRVEQWLLIIVGLITVSGFWGLAIQNLAPRLMKITTPLEAMPEQIPQVCQALCAAADREVKRICGSLLAADEGDERSQLREFYRTTVRPFLSPRWTGTPRLYARSEAETLFSEVSTLLPADYHDTLVQLKSMCEERRQLANHLRIHGWLNHWMLVHLPLSTALLVFLAAHIVMSLIVY